MDMLMNSLSELSVTVENAWGIYLFWSMISRIWGLSPEFVYDAPERGKPHRTEAVIEAAYSPYNVQEAMSKWGSVGWKTGDPANAYFLACHPDCLFFQLGPNIGIFLPSPHSSVV